MADRDLWIRIKADVGSLMTGLSKASAKVRDFDRDLAKNAAKRQALDDLGTSYRNVALGAAAGIAAVVKTAMDWETAWAGVSKTVDGNAAQMAKLEGQLREMARTMPATHQEIAATAQAAGALGVATADIAGFTRTMVMLGEATDDLTAEQAATGMQRFMNVMQTAPGDVDNLANALVRLGNNGASTEGQILDMAQNIAGAGKAVGLSEADVLGLANALSSVGIEAEAGGSAVSNILIDMARAAKTGAPQLKTWASVTGQTVDEFKRMMQQNPAEAFNLLTQGLGKINDKGGDVFTLLKDLGQADVRVTRALLGMAGSGDILSDSLADSADALANGNDAADEYAKRAETAAAQAKVAWNGIKDNLIDIGSDALPVVKDLSDAVSDLTDMFSDLPKPVQGGVLKVLAMTAALAGGMYAVTRARTGFANLAMSFEESGKAAEGAGRRYALIRGGAGGAGIALLGFKDAIGDVNSELGQVAGILGNAAVGFAVGGPWGAAVGAGIGIVQAFATANQHATADVDSLTESLNQQSGALTANSREMVKNALEKDGAFKEARRLGVNLGDVTDAALGDKAALNRIKAQRDAAAAAARAAAEAQSPGSGLAQSEGVKKNFDDLTGSISAQSGAIADARQKWENLTEAQRKSRELNSLTEAQVNKVTKAVKGMPRKVATQFTQPGYEKAVENAANIGHKYKMTPKEVATALRALDYTKPQIAAVLRRMEGLDKKTAKPKVRVDPGNSFSIINGIQRAVNGMTGNTIYVKVAQKGGTPGGLTREAHGGVLDFYANGGLRENHVAQIAPAGSWRVWAEPETGGEGYIPLAPGPKRKRALEVHAEVGRRIGAVGYANGGINGSPALPAGALLAPGARFRLVGPDLIELIDNRAERVNSKQRKFDKSQRSARR